MMSGLTDMVVLWQSYELSHLCCRSPLRLEAAPRQPNYEPDKEAAPHPELTFSYMLCFVPPYGLGFNQQ